MLGRSMGVISADIALNTAPLAAGVTKAKGMMRGLDATLATSTQASIARINNLGHAFVKAGKIIGVAAIAIGAASLKLAADFDKGMREVNTLILAGEERFQGLKDEVLAMSTEVEHSATDLTKAFYQIVSGLPDASDAQRLEALRLVSKGATAGVVEDLESLSRALTSSMNAWGMSFDESERVMDALLMTVTRGQTTLPELAANINKVGASAAALKIPIETAMAATAAMTKSGMSTDKAMTHLNRAMLGLISPSKELDEWFESIGYTSASAAIEAVGFEGVLREIHNAFGDNIDAMGTLFPNIRELVAELILAGGGFETFMADMDAFTETAGLTDKMTAEMAKTLDYQLNVALNNLKAALIPLGEKIMPHVSSALEKITSIIKGENKAFNTFANVVKTAGKALWNLGEALANAWPLLIALGGAVAAVKISSLVTAFRSLNMAAGAGGLAGGLVVLKEAFANLTFFGRGAFTAANSLAASFTSIGLAVAPVAVGVGLLIKHWKDTDREAEKAWQTIRQADKEMAKFGKDMEPMIDRFIELRNKTERSNEEQEEFVGLQQELADKAPELTMAIDEQGDAILKSDDALRSYVDNWTKFAGITVKTTGEVGKFEEGLKTIDSLNEVWEEQGYLIDKIVAQMQALNVEAGDVSKIEHWLAAGDWEKAKEVLDAVLVNMREAGDLDTTDWQDLGAILDKVTEGGTDAEQIIHAIHGDMDALGESITKNEVSFGELDNQLQELIQSTNEMRPAFMEAARAAGEAGETFNEDFITALQADLEQFSSMGQEALQNYIAGIAAQKGIATEDVHSLILEMTGQLSTGDVKAAWETAGKIGIQDLSQGIISQFLPMAGEISMEAGKIPEQIAWALRSGIPQVEQAANALLTSTVVNQVRGVVPQLAPHLNQIPDAIKNGLTSVYPEVRQATADALTEYIRQFGELNNLTGPELENFVGNIKAKLSGEDWTPTGDVVTDQFLGALAKGLGKGEDITGPLRKSIEDGLGDISTEGARKKIVEWATPAGEEAAENVKKPISKGVEQGARDGVAKADSVLEGWTPPTKRFKVEPTVAKATVTITVGPGSGYGPLDWWIKQAKDKIENANPEMRVTVGAGGGMGAMGSSLETAWNQMISTLGTFWDAMEGRKLRELEEALVAMTGGYEHLGFWRNLQDELAKAQARVDALSDSIEQSEDKISGWQREQELIQRRINEVRTSTEGWTRTIIKNGRKVKEWHQSYEELQKGLTETQNKLNRLSQISLKGETKSDEKSFRLQQGINKLELERLQIERKIAAGKAEDADFARLREIDLTKEKLNLDKQIHDLNAETTYGPQKREIEQLLDPLHGVELSKKQIISRIKKAQKEEKHFRKEIELVEQVIANQEKKHARIAKLIQTEQDAVFDLKIEFDNARVHVDYFEQRIDQLAAHFLTRIREMREGWDDYMKQVFEDMFVNPPSGGGPQLSGVGGAPSPQINQYAMGSMTVNVPVFLDGKQIAHSTTRVTGGNASAYARSGGKY